MKYQSHIAKRTLEIEDAIAKANMGQLIDSVLKLEKNICSEIEKYYDEEGRFDKNLIAKNFKDEQVLDFVNRIEKAKHLFDNAVLKMREYSKKQEVFYKIEQFINVISQDFDVYSIKFKDVLIERYNDLFRKG